MALIYSKKACKAAGTFTTNVVKAAPVKWDQKVVAGTAPVHVVVINSGIANACTGAEGMEYCLETAKEAAKVLGVPEEGVLIGSTGVIGMQIPIERLKAGITLLADSKKKGSGSRTPCGKGDHDHRHKRKRSGSGIHLRGRNGSYHRRNVQRVPV